MASITPFCRGQRRGCAGTCPRRPTEIWPASPPLEGAMLHLRGCVPPAANRKLGSTTPLWRGAMLHLRGYVPPEANRNLVSIAPAKGGDAAR